MNYLAHAYLSFNKPEILVGNMISDFVKGKKKFFYSEEIQAGMTLHRAIDEFTDNHASIKKAKEFFRPYYRLYSGAIVDVLLDYYLANDATQFSEESLQAFAKSTYKHLEERLDGLPENFIRMFPYMKEQNWLFNYRHTTGIQRSLGGLVRRAAYLTESDTAYEIFLEHYDELRFYYAEFFEDVKTMAKARLQQLL